jgi:hypothetical protein
MTRENGHAEALDSGLVAFQIEALSKKVRQEHGILRQDEQGQFRVSGLGFGGF